MRPGLFLFGSFVVLGLCGCGGYHLGAGSGQIAGAKTIQVDPFSNQTLKPKLGDAVTAALRTRFQRDATYRLATQDAGDVILTGQVIRYDRVTLSYQPTDVLTPLDVRVNLAVHVKATERATGKVLFERDVTGYTLIRVGSDLTSAERQGLPLLAENLAQNVASLLGDQAW